MRWQSTLVIVAGLVASSATAADWLTAPSYFTHDWTTGERVAQYAPIGPYYYFTRPDYVKSGYRQYRSTIDLGNSSDNMHVVEQWGAPVVPYEAWRFPYRPYGVPYGAWGPPFGGLGGGTGGYPYSGGTGANIYGGLLPPFSGYGGFGPYGSAFNSGASALGAGPAGPGSGFPTPPFGGHGHSGHHGSFFPPAVNFAQPWLDGHYPSYDLNDRSQYWRPYADPQFRRGP
jgi:hypothetical protein